MGAVPSQAPRGRTHLGLSRTVWLSLLLLAVIALSAALAGPARLRGSRFALHQHSGGQQPGSGGQSQPGQPPHLKGIPVVHPPAQIGLWVAIGALIVLVAGLAGFLTRLWRRRRRRGDGSPTAAAIETPWWKVADAEPDRDSLERGIAVAVAALEQPRDPADAITRAWLALEAAAEASGVRRRAAETPTEFTGRVMQRAFSAEEAIQRLLGLYLRTRFGGHRPTTADVITVRAALAQLLESRSRPGTPVGSGR